MDNYQPAFMDALLRPRNNIAQDPRQANGGDIMGQPARREGKGKEGLKSILQGVQDGMGRTGIPEVEHLMAEILPSSSAQFLESLFARSMRR